MQNNTSQGVMNKSINEQKSKNVFKLGFIGGGLSSSIGRAHFIASQLDGRWKLVSGFFSRNSDVNHKTAEAWHVDKNRIYDSVQSFVTSEKNELDAVVVLTPSPDHDKIVCALLEENIPVICEKPLASSVEQAVTIQKSFQKSSNFLAVTYNYSGYPMVRELRELVRNGELGQLQKIDFEMPQEGLIRKNAVTGKLTPPKDWRLRDDLIPTVCLDLGVHLHHLANFITNKEPTRVMGEFSGHSAYGNVIGDVMMWLKYDDDLKGSFWMSKTALGHRNGLKLRLYGTKASAQWVQEDPENMLICYQDGTRTNVDRASKTALGGEARYNRYIPGHPTGFLEAFANLYSDIADALDSYRTTGKHQNSYVFGIDHSIRGLKLFAAARKSNDDRCWVKLNL
jgi:predicted dehydrogenase